MRYLFYIISAFACFLTVHAAEDEPLSDYKGTDFYTVAQSVARITVPAGQATAWVIGPNLVLTNKHVVGDAADAKAAELRFFTTGERFNDLTLIETPFTGDWALLRVEDSDWVIGEYPALPLDLDPQPYQVLYVIGHPDKRISRYSDDDRDNDTETYPLIPSGTVGLGHTWADASGNLAGCNYGVPTAAGYSGSPVMTIVDGKHRAVGLHANPSSGIWLNNIHPKIYKWLPPRSAGAIAFDDGFGRISDDGSVEVTLLDSDLAGSGSYVLTLTTDSGDSNTLTLNEDTDEPGRFTGSIDLDDTSGGVTTDNGVLEVNSMDRIIATYADADDGSGAPATVVRADPVDRRASDFWYLAERGPAMSRVRIDLQRDDSHADRYRGSIGPITDLLAHTTPTVHELSGGESVEMALSTPLQFYGRQVNRVWLHANGYLAIDQGASSPAGIFLFKRNNASVTLKVEETAGALLVSWSDIPLDSDPDNAATVSSTMAYQLSWATSGTISLLYGAMPAGSTVAPIGLDDGAGREELVDTDFLTLPRSDSPVSGPLIVQQPADQISLPFYPAQMEVEVVGQGTISYQWYEDGQRIDDATDSVYTNWDAPAEANYHVVISDDTGSAVSRVASYSQSTERTVTITVEQAGQTWENTPAHGFADFADFSTRIGWRTNQLFSVIDYTFTPDVVVSEESN